MEKLIMGIDPGTNFMGYAIIKIADTFPKPVLVVSGVLDMDKITDPYLNVFSNVLFRSSTVTNQTSWQ